MKCYCTVHCCFKYRNHSLIFIFRTLPRIEHFTLYKVCIAERSFNEHIQYHKYTQAGCIFKRSSYPQLWTWNNYKFDNCGVKINTEEKLSHFFKTLLPSNFMAISLGLFVENEKKCVFKKKIA